MPVVHGARVLRSVVVDAYNFDLREGGRFVGDRAHKRAFKAIVDQLRDRCAISTMTRWTTGHLQIMGT